VVDVYAAAEAVPGDFPALEQLDGGGDVHRFVEEPPWLQPVPGVHDRGGGQLEPGDDGFGGGLVGGEVGAGVGGPGVVEVAPQRGDLQAVLGATALAVGEPALAGGDTEPGAVRAGEGVDLVEELFGPVDGRPEGPAVAAGAGRW
jgi:hypothetical protein